MNTALRIILAGLLVITGAIGCKEKELDESLITSQGWTTSLAQNGMGEYQTLGTRSERGDRISFIFACSSAKTRPIVPALITVKGRAPAARDTSFVSLRTTTPRGDRRDGTGGDIYVPDVVYSEGFLAFLNTNHINNLLSSSIQVEVTYPNVGRVMPPASATFDVSGYGAALKTAAKRCP